MERLSWTAGDYFKNPVQPSAPAVPAPGSGRNRQKRYKNRLKKQLLREDPYCYYCCKRLAEDTATLDHAVPRSKGGRTSRKNIVLACLDCNREKGDKVAAARHARPP